LADGFQVKSRYQAGASLTTSGTAGVVVRASPIPIANYVLPYSFEDIITGIAAGQTTIGLTVQRLSGSGDVSLYGAATAVGILTLEDIGV
jgi:hypothetical protein